MKVILSTAYFAPVQWYQKLNRYDEVLIERYDSYQKQTYRNRCIIATANGLQALTVPVEHQDGNCLLRDLRISDHGNWRHLHRNALMSAYGDSPFFEYYADDVLPFFEPRWEFLIDFNEAIRQKMCELIDIHPSVAYTDAYVKNPPYADFREAIRPKHPAPDADFSPRRYYQVYEQKHGFLPNLSILDLLFNMGPEGVFWINRRDRLTD
jgi:hypothetical protein